MRTIGRTDVLFQAHNGKATEHQRAANVMGMAVIEAKNVRVLKSSVIIHNPISKKNTPDSASSKNFHTMSNCSRDLLSKYFKPKARRNKPAAAQATAGELCK